MADVFISYSQKDRDVARGLADLLSDCGYDVWWDYELVGGVKFRNTIKEELAKAKAAIVIWTPNSVESDWVIEEAEEAKQTQKLIATRTDGFDYRAIPLGFRSLQTDVITAPERILKALEMLGVAPSRPPKPPKPVVGKGLDSDSTSSSRIGSSSRTATTRRHTLTLSRRFRTAASPRWPKSRSASLRPRRGKSSWDRRTSRRCGNSRGSLPTMPARKRRRAG